MSEMINPDQSARELAISIVKVNGETHPRRLISALRYAGFDDSTVRATMWGLNGLLHLNPNLTFRLRTPAEHEEAIQRQQQEQQKWLAKKPIKKELGDVGRYTGDPMLTEMFE